MRGLVSRHLKRLGHGAALLVIGSLAAGCSSGMSRFATDDIFTSSTANQQSIVNSNQVASSSTGDTYTAAAGTSGSVGRSSLPPVASASAEPIKRKPTTVKVDPLSRSVERDGEPATAKPNRVVASAKSSPGLKPLGEASSTPAKATAAVQTAPTKPAKSGNGAYTVAEGDTLSRIAKKHGVSVAALKAANGDSDAVRIGQELKIPAAGTTVAAAKPAAKVDPVQTASTPPKPEKLAASEKPQLTAYTPPQKTKAIEAVESESDEAAPNASGIGRMRWPAKGRVAKSRDGIDIQVPEGTAVKAAENGVVIYAGDGLKDFGNTVLVRHENGLVTVYGHASALNVKRGQKVKRGEQIATSGMSGEAKQPKLHFEVRKDSAPVDPSAYLE